MQTDADPLQSFLASRMSQCDQIVDWPLARLMVNGYLGDQLPPDEYITSVRAIVLRQLPSAQRAVLVVQDPHSYHIIPGGRREQGETLAQTAMREVVEETGWQVTIGQLLGFLHFQHLTPLPPEIQGAKPTFVQLIYLAEPHNYCAEAREVNGDEIDAKFVRVDQLHEYNISKSERLFLEAALAQMPQKE